MVYRTPRARKGGDHAHLPKCAGKVTRCLLESKLLKPNVSTNSGQDKKHRKKIAKNKPKQNTTTNNKKTNNRGQEAEARSSVRGQRSRTVSLEEGTSRLFWEKQPLGCAALGSYRLSQRAKQNAAPRIQLRCAKRFLPQAQHSQRTNHLCWSLPGIRRLHKMSIEKDKASYFVDKRFG